MSGIGLVGMTNHWAAVLEGLAHKSEARSQCKIDTDATDTRQCKALASICNGGPVNRKLLTRSKNIPFRSNTISDTNCLEASLSMVIEHFTGCRLSMAQLEKLTEKVPGEASSTWSAFPNLHKYGFKFTTISEFDDKKFGNLGYQYVEDLLGYEIAQQWKSVIDLEEEQGRALKTASISTNLVRRPTIKDIENMIDAGKVCMVYVNAAALFSDGGFVGHYMVILDYDRKKQTITLHNPGLPAQPNRVVSYRLFEQAWYLPNPKQSALFVIEHKSIKRK